MGFCLTVRRRPAIPRQASPTQVNLNSVHKSIIAAKPVWPMGCGLSQLNLRDMDIFVLSNRGLTRATEAAPSQIAAVAWRCHLFSLQPLNAAA